MFYLPLPSPVLNPNARTHWAVKCKHIKEARTEARKEAHRVLTQADMEPPKWATARINAVFYLTKNRTAPDPDNAIASLKAYIDGISDAGIVSNDKTLWPERPEFRKTDKMPRVELTVTQE